MKLFAKVFICASILISLSLLVSGYLLITNSFHNSMEREIEHALDQYQLHRFQIQGNLLLNIENDETSLPQAIRELNPEITANSIFYDKNQQELFSAFPDYRQNPFSGDMSEYNLLYQVVRLNDRYYVYVVGGISIREELVFFLNIRDVTTVFDVRNQMVSYFTNLYFATLLISMIFIVVMTYLLIRPLRQMNIMAAQIAKGSYDVRIPNKGADEIGELASSFNSMSDAIEEKMHELERNAEQKEEFVANFAHEIKTPLTSVIGYADMLYQRDFSDEQVKTAASYILYEGMRLESLSMKLLDLIILGKRDFILEQVSIKETIRHIIESIQPLIQDHKIGIKLDLDEAEVLVEYDLFKTLFLNLIDNAIKAESSKLHITGKINQSHGKRYTIAIIDDGKGIPKSELSRITEAFYMVDKSRKNESGRAGLGLALASKICLIHGSEIRIESKLNYGTTIFIDLRQGGSND